MNIPAKTKMPLSIQKIKAIRLACLKSAENRSQKRLSNLIDSRATGIIDIGKKVSNRDLLFFGLGLYWGEGYKNGNGEFGFTNSDPEMVKIYLKILRNVYGVKDEQLVLKININKLFAENQSEIEKYWQLVTKIDKTGLMVVL